MNTLVKFSLKELDLALQSNKNEQIFDDLRQVSRNLGIFYLVDHFVDELLIEELFELSKQFFALPLEQKEEIAMIKSPQFRGYSKEGGEYTAGSKDYREQIDLGTDKKPLKWDLNSPLYKRLEGSNLYPKAFPRLKELFLSYQAQTNKAAITLLKAFSKALELEDDAFDKLYGQNTYEHYKIIRYPAAFDNNTQGVGAHKDGGLITFVLQHEEAGLQGLINGIWQDIPPVKNSFVVNIGEFLEMATNGYLKATIHRVNLSAKQRFSIAYFLGVQLDKDIPIFKLKEKYAKDAKGVDTDPKNPLLRNVAQNYFKRMIRSHPDVAKVHHSDLIEKFSFA
ncbi:2-oxobutyrate oxidase [Campylobacter sp. MIT 99-7217]|uniref:isopenicillin N synthase family dioxygenase n=1 Tax=Campylobacter sp. MIT 99-7217 TaxID=535091 RepID=UPI00115AA42C|nr:2-oxoglutarate and iron-dependent oxygenase domain-containing protein [Campylobacter sp. MIT 99-7217]TQR29514.1 2-oxobutyrate oxidase [Campylobacter sp. MIT 99-7217]